ncbi:MAG: DeoR/GlpR transcriptional regulator [Lentisphaerae bacterium]|nr:DeoR/GlpR transcriptional regulator [Lentisphaerota bacterium]
MSGTVNAGLAAGRQERVRGVLRERGVVSVEELRARLGVSGATVRRDLEALNRRGQVRRVHGGAVCVEGRLDEPLFDDKTAIAAREKQRIAEAALKLVKQGDSVFLDGGSTVLALARLLTGYSGLTAVTNSLRVAALFAGVGPRVIMAGGELRRLSQTFVGALSRPLLEQLRFDTAFMGTIGLTAADGMTTTDAREALTKETVMANARRVVLLADGSKIGAVSFVKVGALDKVDVLITDSGADRGEVARLRKKGVKVVTA